MYLLTQQKNALSALELTRRGVVAVPALPLRLIYGVVED
jgi:hypothetical protein